MTLKSRITSVPQLRGEGDKRFATFTIAKKCGDETLWVNAIAFGKVADKATLIPKGCLVTASGDLRPDTYKPKGTETEVKSFKLIVNDISVDVEDYCKRQAAPANSESEGASDDNTPE